MHRLAHVNRGKLEGKGGEGQRVKIQLLDDVRT
jgi:hypothetical protein